MKIKNALQLEGINRPPVHINARDVLQPLNRVAKWYFLKLHFGKCSDEQCLHSQPAQISHYTGPWFRGQCQSEFNGGFNSALVGKCASAVL